MNKPAHPIPPESGDERNERIFQSLPAPLGCPAYIKLLREAPASDLPAAVLVRAYRQLQSGPAADATLDRLLGQNEKYGYITPLYRMARRRITRNDPYGVPDLVQDTIGEVLDTLGGPKGAGAEKVWLSYLRQRMVDAHRKQVGRRAERRPERAENLTDPETGEEIDAIDATGVTMGPWQGRVEASDLQWLEEFIRRTFARIPDERMREVALDMLRDKPTPVSGEDPAADTLERRYGVKRFTIYRWQRSAAALLKAALERQSERPNFDISFLEGS
jgi:hypothetical protein